ncbi:bidirectional sugar transporter SWEET13-like [Spinacia oleracea]|uniref:Bidirectional sugar transporter SWEET n=1 Tax=Spinacia oleracea TaxID=3562 RepID=A0ABM3RP65_SPIOL|nr:bidirectional sugar transporter SWEET13-like [Spinacia oleracea]
MELLKPGAMLVATVNGFGAVVELVYITLFLIFASPQTRAKTAKLVVLLDVGFLGAVMLISKFWLEGDTRIQMIGALGAFVNILMYGSPLAALRAVMETRSVEYMPFLLSLCSFLNGGIWTIYAVLVKDLFLLDQRKRKGSTLLRPSAHPKKAKASQSSEKEAVSEVMPPPKNLLHFMPLPGQKLKSVVVAEPPPVDQPLAEEDTIPSPLKPSAALGIEIQDITKVMEAIEADLVPGSDIFVVHINFGNFFFIAVNMNFSYIFYNTIDGFDDFQDK